MRSRKAEATARADPCGITDRRAKATAIAGNTGVQSLLVVVGSRRRWSSITGRVEEVVGVVLRI
jgi:hypothetical protein